MALADIVKGTSDGKIQWRKHDSGEGYWAHVDGGAFRLDLIDGKYTLMRGNLVVEKADDDGTLAAIIGKYDTAAVKDALAEFATKLAATDANAIIAAEIKK